MLNTIELMKYIFLLVIGVSQLWIGIAVYKKNPCVSNFWFLLANNFISLCWFNIIFSEGIIANLYNQPTSDTVPTGEPLMIILSISSSLTHYIAPYCYCIFVLWYSNFLVDKTKRTRYLIYFLYFIPVIIMNVVFPVHNYKYYHINSKPFWIASSIHVVILFAICNIILLISAIRENNATKKVERKFICAVSVTLTSSVAMFTFISNIFNLRDLFLLNTIFLVFCIALVMRFSGKFGFLGFRIYLDKYRLDTSSNTLSPGSSILGHELRNEINKIGINVANIENPDIADNTDEIRNIKKSVTQMHSLIKRILDNLSEMTFEVSKTNLYQLVFECINSLNPILSENNISTSVKIPHDVDIRCDQAHMTAVLNNLFKNSIEAMEQKDGGKILIETRIDKSQLILYIKDNGKGINNDESKYLFDAYFTTKKGSKSNLGLGLFYCYKVLKAHGGSINIKNISEGFQTGAEVSLNIPISRVVIVPDQIEQTSTGVRGRHL